MTSLLIDRLEAQKPIKYKTAIIVACILLMLILPFQFYFDYPHYLSLDAGRRISYWFDELFLYIIVPVFVLVYMKRRTQLQYIEWWTDKLVYSLKTELNLKKWKSDTEPITILKDDIKAVTINMEMVNVQTNIGIYPIDLKDFDPDSRARIIDYLEKVK